MTVPEKTQTTTSTPPAPSTTSRATVVSGVAVVVVVVGLACLVWQLAGVLAHTRDAFLLDVGVFRDAGQAILDGNAIYGDDFPSRSGFAFDQHRCRVDQQHQRGVGGATEFLNPAERIGWPDKLGLGAAERQGSFRPIQTRLYPKPET